MRWSPIVLGCLVACGVGAKPERVTSVKPIAPVQPAITTAVEERVAAISGTHGAPIEIVAVTSEGDAAISADIRGAIRVWPTLDGTREPFVVHAQRPSELVIAHDGDGFVIANIDVANGLELIRLDDRGGVRGRVMTRGEAVQDVVVLGRTVLVLRADQVIEVLDPGGERTKRLVPDAGTRLSRLLPAGDRVLAVGVQDNKTFVRWIQPDATWGIAKTIPGIDPSRPLGVSPDHASLVSNFVSNHLDASRLFDLRTGKEGTRICSGHSKLPTVALGFIDADTIACIQNGKHALWSMSTGRTATVRSRNPAGEGDVAVARGVVVSGSGHNLVLRTRDSEKQLGYATSSNTVVRFSPGGITIAGVRRSLVVDATLRARTSVEHPLDEGLLAIGDGYAIGISTPEVSVNDAWGASHALSVFDLARGVTHQKIAVRTSDALAFEPATGWLATIDGAITKLLRYDGKTHMFGAPIDVEAEGVIHRIMLLDPALANGVVALTLEERAGSAIVGEIDARDLVGTSVRTRRTYRVAGNLLAIDRVGRVYSNDRQARLRVSKGDHPARELPIFNAQSVVPDADGSRLAIVRRGEVALHLADGTLVWATRTPEVRQVRWLGNDLVASFADSLARFDLATGELTARPGGWDFGLHEIESSGSGNAENVCDAD